MEAPTRQRFESEDPTDQHQDATLLLNGLDDLPAPVAGSNHHHDQNQGQGDADEQLTTNCSASMSSGSGSEPENDHEELNENCDGHLSESRVMASLGVSAGQHSSIEQQRLQSGRNRLGTPRHGGASQPNGKTPKTWPTQQRSDIENCDRFQNDDSALELGPLQPLIINGNGNNQLQQQRQQQQQDESSELSFGGSVTSGQGQGPPSYGTAMRTCATLDVAQLQQMHLRRRQHLQLQQQQQHQSAASDQLELMAMEALADVGCGSRQINQATASVEQATGARCLAPSPSGSHFPAATSGLQARLNHVSLGNLAAILKQKQQPKARPLDDSYGFLKLDKNQQHWDLGAPASSSSPFQRQVSPMLQRQAQEGIYATLNVTPHFFGVRPSGVNGANGCKSPVPINHVISARESMQQPQQLQIQPQQCNQVQPRLSLQVDPQQQQWRQQAHNQLLLPMNQQQPPVASHGQQQRRLQELLIDIYGTSYEIPSGGGSSGALTAPSTMLVRNRNGANDATRKYHYQTDAFASGFRQGQSSGDVANSSGAKLRNGDESHENAHNDSGARTNELPFGQQRSHSYQATTTCKNPAAKQRRRRHKSTSGQQQQTSSPTSTTSFGMLSSAQQRRLPDRRGVAGLSPPVQAINYRPSSGVEAQQVRSPSETMSRLQPQTLPTTTTTISAHCWLIDSSDEQQPGRSHRRHQSPGSNSTTTRPGGRICKSHSSLSSASLVRRQDQRSRPRNGKAASKKHSRCRRVHQASLPNVAVPTSDLDPEDELCSEDDEADDWRSSVSSARATYNSRRTRRRQSQPQSNAGAVLRLSAVLSFVSNLVGRNNSRRARSLCSKSPSSEASSSRYQASSTGSTSNQQPSYSHNAASQSLAYSSSTSAYVTGGSSLHSHDCNSLQDSRGKAPDGSVSSTMARGGRCFASGPQKDASPTTFMTLKPEFSGLRDVAATQAELMLSLRQQQNQFYTLTSTRLSAPYGLAGVQSHHSYEYCDQDSVAAPSNGTMNGVNSIKVPSTYIADPIRRTIPKQQLQLTAGEHIEMSDMRLIGTTSSRAAPSPSNSGSNLEEDQGEPAQESSSQSTCSPTQMVGLNQTGLIASRDLNDHSRLTQILMSDNELISSATSNNGQAGAGASTSARSRRRADLADRVAAPQRRRWWWNSFKLWLMRRPPRLHLAHVASSSAGWTEDDEDADDDASLTRQRPAGPPNCNSLPEEGQARVSAIGQQAASYKSLKSRTTTRRTHGGSSNDNRSTLKNVISLAKVDSVFRCRLLASLFVSLVLILLICLLSVIIFRRNLLLAAYNSQLGRGLGPDANQLQPLEDEYDLSWLWPDGHISRQAASGRFQERQPNEESHVTIDSNLRSLMHQIDRSERLQQFQLAMTHMTNLQLACDHFIDIQQQVAAGTPSAGAGLEAGQGETLSDQNATSSANNGTHLASKTTPITQQPSKVSNLELNLYSLMLLSNLHWPLIKWRHQSQQSAIASSFLSFALPSSMRSGTGASGDEPPSLASSPSSLQTLRALLSSLILVDSLNPQLLTNAPANSNYAHLQQFRRLHLNLRLSAYHLLTCSQELDGSTQAASELSGGEDAEWPLARERFCSLLLQRYESLMSAMSRLSHHDLKEMWLHRAGSEHFELPASVFNANSQGLESSKNLLGFLLDRLALLDVRLVAELTITSLLQEGSGSTSWFASQESSNLDEAANQFSSLASRLVELLVSNQDQIDAKSGNLQFAPAQAEHEQLLELVEQSVGHDLRSWMAMSSSRAKLEDADEGPSPHSSSHEPKTRGVEWRHSLVRDLVAPWPIEMLPRLMQVQSYELVLQPNLTTRLVLGLNKIEFQLERPTSFLVLNCAHLNLVELSLWRKQMTSQKSSNASGSQPNANQPIPIRRVLNLERQQMLFIELFEPLEPLSSVAETSLDNRKLNESRFQAWRQQTIDFGELSADKFHASTTSQQQQQQQATSKAFANNQFVLNVSFNKTSLMQLQGHKDEGLEFIKYADYFAGQQVAPEVISSSTSKLIDADGEELSWKTLMFTRFSSLEPASPIKESHLKQRLVIKHKARHLFPCLDEPHLRAKFQLNLLHDAHSQALFNGQRKDRLDYNSLSSIQMTVFEQTPIPLSPSSLSIVVFDLQGFRSLASRATVTAKEPTTATTMTDSNTSQPPTSKPVQVLVWTQFEHQSQAEFASQLLPQLLGFYQSRLEFAYPLDKLDLIALPGGGFDDSEGIASIPALQLDRGGLGLIRLSDGANDGPSPLLLDPNLINQNLIERVSLQLSRQLARQYFGQIIAPQDAVTSPPSNWWLFEALNEHLQLQAVSEVQPDWHLDEQYQSGSLSATLAREQLNQLASASSMNSWWWGEEFLESSSKQGESFETLSIGTHVEEEKASAAGEFTASEAIAQQLWEFRRRTSKSSAVIHMLLHNLLPTQDGRMRLLRRCLQSYQYATMNSRQFWHLFGRQMLAESAQVERLQALHLLEPGEDLMSQLLARDQTQPLVTIFTAATDESPGIDSQTSPTVAPNHNNSATSERVVFVGRKRHPPSSLSKTNSRRTQTLGDQDVHRVRPFQSETGPLVHAVGRSFVDSLELVASNWLERDGLPMISASCHRDRLLLRQEQFRLRVSRWPIETSDEADNPEGAKSQPASRRVGRDTRKEEDPEQQNANVWPIPLMFVSRLNPKSARFVWLNKREIELPLDQTSSLGNSVGSPSGEFAPSVDSSDQHYTKLPQQYSWFKLNHNRTSLVRVNYDERNWEALSNLLAKSHYSNHLLNPLDRGNLLDDSMTLMNSGQLSVSLAMNLTLYLELGERDYQPWSTIIEHLEQMRTLLNQNPLWHQYVLKLIQPISVVVGWKDDGPHLMRKLRRELFHLAIQYKDEKIVSRARQEFKSWMLKSSGHQFIVPNLQELVYVAGVRYGDQQEWFHCWQRYQQLVALSSQSLSMDSSNQTSGGTTARSRDHNGQQLTKSQLLQVAARSSQNGLNNNRRGPSSYHSQSSIGGQASGGILDYADEAGASAGLVENEKRQLLTALASTQNTWLLEQFLNYSLDASKVQPHHLRHVFETLGKNPVARLYLWRFVRLHWPELRSQFLYNKSNQQQRLLETMILASTKHFSNQLDYDEVSSFFVAKYKLDSAVLPQHWTGSIKRAIQESLATIRANIYWRQSVEPKLTRWLSHHNNVAVA